LISVKDGANITPQFYDTITFAPYRKIIIPYKTCDNIGLSRAETHKLLDKILDNEDEYMTKGFEYYERNISLNIYKYSLHII
jgi:hypothetical protein